MTESIPGLPLLLGLGRPTFLTPSKLEDTWFEYRSGEIGRSSIRRAFATISLDLGAFWELAVAGWKHILYLGNSWQPEMTNVKAVTYIHLQTSKHCLTLIPRTIMNFTPQGSGHPTSPQLHLAMLNPQSQGASIDCCCKLCSCATCLYNLGLGTQSLGTEGVVLWLGQAGLLKAENNTKRMWSVLTKAVTCVKGADIREWMCPRQHNMRWLNFQGSFP